MAREWKPGDVATGLLDGNEIIGIVRGGGKRMFYADSVTTDQVDLKHVRNLRPLVVIDPESLDDVERVRDACWRGGSVGDWQEYLRALADPKPPCGASLTLGKDGALYRCSEAADHKGPHADGTCVWTAEGPS